VAHAIEAALRALDGNLAPLVGGFRRGARPQ